MASDLQVLSLHRMIIDVNGQLAGIAIVGVISHVLQDDSRSSRFTWHR